MEMEYRIRVTLAEHGQPGIAEDNGERLLDAFEKVHPEVGPSVSADFRQGTLSVLFSLDAEDANKAFERGRPIFAAGLRASRLRATPVTRIEIEAVPANEFKESELQPA
jgi:hypothetical protein